MSKLHKNVKYVLLIHQQRYSPELRNYFTWNLLFFQVVSSVTFHAKRGGLLISEPKFSEL